MTQVEGIPFRRHGPPAALQTFLEPLHPGGYLDCGHARLHGIDDALVDEARRRGRAVGDDSFQLVATDTGLFFCRPSIGFAISAKWSELQMIRPNGEDPVLLKMTWPKHGELEFTLSKRLGANVFRRWLQLQMKDATDPRRSEGALGFRLDPKPGAEPTGGDPASIDKLVAEKPSVATARRATVASTGAAAEGGVVAESPAVVEAVGAVGGSLTTELVAPDEGQSNADSSGNAEGQSNADGQSYAEGQSADGQSKDDESALGVFDRPLRVLNPRPVEKGHTLDAQEDTDPLGRGSTITASRVSLIADQDLQRVVPPRPVATSTSWVGSPLSLVAALVFLSSAVLVVAVAVGVSRRNAQSTALTPSGPEAELVGTRTTIDHQRFSPVADQTSALSGAAESEASADGSTATQGQVTLSDPAASLLTAGQEETTDSETDGQSSSGSDDAAGEASIGEASSDVANSVDTESDQTDATSDDQTTDGYAGTPTGAEGALRCDSNYSGCVPPVADLEAAPGVQLDVDCEGHGDGPWVIAEPVLVLGTDIYELDSDGDGLACEADQFIDAESSESEATESESEGTSAEASQADPAP